MTAARETHQISERRACDVLGAERSVVRYRAQRADDAPIRTRLRALAGERRRFGYRRLGLLLAREGVRLNHKKQRRLYRAAALQVRQRGGRKRALGTSRPGAAGGKRLGVLRQNARPRAISWVNSRMPVPIPVNGA